jgi:hypothetical protein
MKKNNLFRVLGIVLTLALAVMGCENPVERSESFSRSVMIGTATVSTVDVAGSSGVQIAPVSLTITLLEDTFVDIDAGTILTAWFTNIPANLSAVAASNVSAGDNAIDITISGMPLAGSGLVMAITIPAIYLETGPDPITVDTNTTAVYDITQLIGSVADFQRWATAVNSGDGAQKGTLTTSIDLLSASVSYLPIASSANPYTGTFDGRGNSINNIYISLSTGFVALFAVNRGTIQNLTVTGDVTSIARNADYVAGIAAYNSTEGIIQNVISRVVVNGLNCYNVGGIAGFNGCDVVNSDSPDYGTTYYNGKGKIYQSANTGTVSGYQKIGGIAGENASVIDQCYNTGAITGDAHASNGTGGITGRNGNNQVAQEVGTISNCYNMGTISAGTTSGSWVGGMAGFSNNTSFVSNSYDVGTIVACWNYYNPVIGTRDNFTDSNITNNYSLVGLNATATGTQIPYLVGTVETTAQFQASTFPAQLSAAFKADYSGSAAVNGG